jgi:hypothetical protein
VEFPPSAGEGICQIELSASFPKLHGLQYKRAFVEFLHHLRRHWFVNLSNRSLSDKGVSVGAMTLVAFVANLKLTKEMDRQAYLVTRARDIGAMSLQCT